MTLALRTPVPQSSRSVPGSDGVDVIHFFATKVKEQYTAIADAMAWRRFETTCAEITRRGGDLLLRQPCGALMRCRLVTLFAGIAGQDCGRRFSHLPARQKDSQNEGLEPEAVGGVPQATLSRIFGER